MTAIETYRELQMWFGLGGLALTAFCLLVRLAVFGDAAEMTNRNATEDDIHLALAKHVPALSSPVGGIEISQIINNIDLNVNSVSDGVFRPNGWGRNDDSIYQLKWLHSDMKDMAYFYVHILYNQLVQKGNLR